ncbi:mannose-1-phosphate guanylyltransferase [Lapillicoccus jejuensis]|nr:mannose-1-phosphate guanylyltransferase [Lapillicoccus jejuensis]
MTTTGGAVAPDEHAQQVEQVEGFWGVIPAGGAGTRLWPVSRRTSPKFLRDLTGSGRSLLQATRDRLAPLAGDRVLVVTGAAHVDAVVEQLPDGVEVVAEPTPRDSMPAIALAAAIIERRDADAVIGSFAADHVIGDLPAFHAVVREAVAVARTGRVVTIGLTPTHPATGFGYIREGEALGVDGAPSARAVVEFVEKPDAATAQRYLAEGGFRWNAGMFVVQASVLLDVLAAEHPELAAGVRAVAAEPERLDEVWPGLTKIAIDHAVAEPAAARGLVAVVPAGFSWDDVGDFASLGDLLPEAREGLRVVGEADDVVTVDGGGIVVTGGRVVAVVGLDDVVVVDTPDAVLVMARDRAQDVKKVVERLTAAGRTELT